ncbi:hypothetical protein CUMW_038510 [Citrus unshiu]|nr:hypothetical protein CUMW_038510 [Citrus unshiu]
MEKPWLSFAIILISCLFVVARKNGSVVGQQFPAMFVFGDSLVDCGNNNYISSLARANYLPYGIDFIGAGPTGRFCNGKTIIDFLGDLLGLPLLPPFATTFTDRRDILMGGDRFSLSQQVQNFKTTLDQLKSIIMDERKLQQHLAKSLVVVNIGSNDYINNYLMPSTYSSSSSYNPQQYADLLINHYTSHIMLERLKRSELGKPLAGLRSLLSILALARSLGEVAFSFVCRFTNSAARTVTQVGSSVLDSGEWRFVPPLVS